MTRQVSQLLIPSLLSVHNSELKATRSPYMFSDPPFRSPSDRQYSRHEVGTLPRRSQRRSSIGSGCVHPGRACHCAGAEKLPVEAEDWDMDGRVLRPMVCQYRGCPVRYRSLTSQCACRALRCLTTARGIAGRCKTLLSSSSCCRGVLPFAGVSCLLCDLDIAEAKHVRLLTSAPRSCRCGHCQKLEPDWCEAATARLCRGPSCSRAAVALDSCPGQETSWLLRTPVTLFKVPV